MAVQRNQTNGPDAAPASGASPNAFELEIVDLVSEQLAVPVDQLVRFVGCERGKLEGVLAGMVTKGWLAVGEMSGEPEPWVWVRHGGAEVSSLSFSSRRPTVQSLVHRRVVNEVRLEIRVAAAQAVWVCERRLWADRRGRQRTRPDAVIEVGGKRHALEIELWTKSWERLRRVVAERLSEFDSVVYYCRKGSVFTRMGRLRDELGADALVVRLAPGDPGRVVARAGGYVRQSASEEQIRALRFICEQGAVPEDQLGGLLGLEEAGGRELASSMEAVGLVARVKMNGREAPWLWATSSGCRLSGTGLSPMNRSAGLLSQLRALNAFRAHVERQDGAEWWSRRVLVHGSGVKRSGLPPAVLGFGSGRYGVEFVKPLRNSGVFQCKIERWLGQFDGLVLLCDPAALPSVRRQAERRGWTEVEVRPVTGDGRLRR